MRKAVKIVRKAMVKPIVVYGNEMWPMSDMVMKRQYMEEENIKEDT
jgi:hypothetical protein